MACSSPATPTRYRRGGLHLREALRPGRLDLSMWPSRMYALPVALFTALWLRFLWRWYSLVAATSGESARGFMCLFGLPFVLAGASLLGTTLRLVLGRTQISLDALRFHVAEEGIFGRRAPALVLPVHSIAAFVAESALHFDDDHALDAWHVTAVLHEGEDVRVPLPVKTMAEAELVAHRLERALTTVRAPLGYRS